MTRSMNRNHLRARAIHAKHNAECFPAEPRRAKAVYRYPTGELLAFDQNGDRMKVFDPATFDGDIVDIGYGVA